MTNDTTKEQTKTDAADTRVGTGKLLPFHVFRTQIFNKPADPRYCVGTIYGERVSTHQCSRKPKHQYGGHGWCSQHYPPNVEAREQERKAKWKAESAARSAEWARSEAARKQKDAALEAIKQIAAGHNDPQSLAREVLAMTAKATP